MDYLAGTEYPHYAPSVSTDNLLSQVLAHRCDSHYYDQAMCALKYRGDDQVYESALNLCHSAKPKERSVGYDILSEFGLPNYKRTMDILRVLLDALPSEHDSDCIIWIGSAVKRRLLGCRHNTDEIFLEMPDRIQSLFALSNNRSSYRRYAVAEILGRFLDGGEMSHKATEVLITMTHDNDTDIRVRAIDSLGLSEDNDPDRIAVIDHLLLLAQDDEPLVRAEALFSLQNRDYPGVGALIAQEISSGYVCTSTLRAAEWLADSELCTVLKQVDPDSVDSVYWLGKAINSCCNTIHHDDESTD
ncbi:MAG: HEAT repeat domain-containing protein [Armatimonadota bacterium]